MARSTFRNPRQDLDALLGRLVSERACERLIVSLTHVLDLGSIDDVAAFFTADARLRAGEDTAVGRTDVVAMLRDRRHAAGATRHVLTNVRVQVGDDRTTAAGIAYLQIFASGSTAPVWVGHVRDEYVLDHESWKIASRSLERLAEAAT